jgi:hypothetical protein
MLEFNKIKIEEDMEKDTFSLKRELSLRFKWIKSFIHKVHFNVNLQKLYDDNIDNLNEFRALMEQHNLFGEGEAYLATGVSCYFNKQVDRLGLANIEITGQDLEDVRFIQECFNKKNKYGDNDLQVLYTTLPGTTEISYGMQPFPAGIYEDVFQFSIAHNYTLMPMVGESEVDYYCRNLQMVMDEQEDFPKEKKEEVLERARRVATNFCSGKNRVYLIPISNILHNKASFGDVKGLRDGSLMGEELETKLDEMDSFLELTKKEITSVDIDFKNNRANSVLALYSDPNYFVGETGIAIYGDFSNKGIVYFEIERKYDLLQRKARDLGYVDGDAISDNVLYTPTKK